jgi:hypothetical protein
LKTTIFRALLSHRDKDHLNIFKNTFIESPKTLVIFKGSVVEGLSEIGSTIVIDFTSAMKLIFVPLTFIGQIATIVVQFALTVHSIVFPLTDIVPSIFVVEGPLSVSLAVIDKPTVFTTILIFFFFVLADLFSRAFVRLVIFFRNCSIIF